jgi:peptidyl-prolyl cis-trans isomerase C
MAVLTLTGLAVTLALAGAGSASVVPEEMYRAYASRDYAAAERVLKNALAAATDPDAKLMLGIELGDLDLDKRHDFYAAESTYNELIAQDPNAKRIADVMYRVAVCDEREEEFLDAAQGYEKVAIKYQGSTYAEDALNAIERCFRKNYQDRAAYVDSFPITRLEFDDQVSRAPAQYEKFEEKLKLLNQTIDDRLLHAEADREGFWKNPDFMTQMNDFRRDQMMQAWYDREVVKKVVVDDSMKRNYYRDHKNDYITPEQARAREIQVKTKAAADSLRALIADKKAAFETLAKANSLAPDKDRGGDMGFFRRNTRAREIDDVAFTMKPGDLSQPIKTGESSFVILRLEEKRERKEKAFDEVAAEIEGRLKPQKTQERMTRLLDDLKKGHVVQDTLAVVQNKDTLALVDGAPLRAADLAKMMERIPPMYRAQFEAPEGKKRILDQLITEKLVLRMAEQGKYWLGSDIVGQTIDRERQLMTSMLKKREVTDKVKIGDKEVQADYKKTIKDFYVAEQVRAKEIVLKGKDDANTIRKQLTDPKHPLSFDSLARSMSVAPSRWASGDMGMITRGQKPKPIESALFSLKPKTISSVIKLNDTNFVILRVEEHKKAYTRPLTEVRPKIERKLSQEAEKQQLEAYLADLRGKARIEILLTEENTAPPAAETIPPVLEDSGEFAQPAPQPVTQVPIEVKPIEALPQTVLASVYFGFDKATLGPTARKTLDSLAAALKSQPELALVIAGYTDKTGPDSYNQALALRRASRVVGYLTKAGIDAGRMEARSLGKTGAKGAKPGEYRKDRRADIIAK